MDFYCKHQYYDKPEYESPDFEDIKYWTPKVKHGGLIIGDDYLAFEGVRKAVNDTFSSFNEFGNTWFVEK